MEKWTRLSADQRENLVAYLDGELEDNLTQQIDRVLVQSEVARHEVEALARTWEMLDLLPKPEAPENFTERTLHTLQVSEVRTRLVDQPWFGYVRKGSIAVLWAVGLAACAAIGYAITTQAVPNEQADLLSNLPVVKNLDIYLEVRELSFVTDLQRAAVFNVGDPEAETPTPGRRLAIKPASVAHAVLEERSNEIEKMPASERQRIQYNWTTFQAMSPAQQEEIRALYAQLEQQPETVHTLLDTYAWWLQTLTPGQRDDLRRATTSADRLRLVREFKDKQEASADTKLFDLNLDLQRMKQWMPPPPYLSEQDLAAVMGALLNAIQPGSRQREIRAEAETERYIDTFRHFFWGGPQALTPDELDRVLDAISDENLRKFAQARPEQKFFGVMIVVSRGLHAHVAAELQPHFPKVDQLQAFFATELTSVRREELMKKRSEDLTRELLKDYFEKAEQDNPQLKKLRAFALRLQGFQRPPDPSGGSGRWGRGFQGRPPGDRPPGDERGPRGDGPRPGGPQQPPPAPPERVHKPDL